MPLYVYEAEGSGCERCAGGFEVSQSISEPRLTRCPSCGASVVRVIQAPAIGRSRTDLAYRAKRAGFHALKRVQKGEYEKIY